MKSRKPGRYLGPKKPYYIDFGRAEREGNSRGGKGLVAEDAELASFKSAYRREKVYSG